MPQQVPARKPPDIDALIDLMLRLTPADREKLCRLIAILADLNDDITSSPLQRIAKLATSKRQNVSVLREALDSALRDCQCRQPAEERSELRRLCKKS